MSVSERSWSFLFAWSSAFGSHQRLCRQVSVVGFAVMILGGFEFSGT